MLFSVAALPLASRVSSKKLKQSQASYNELDNRYGKLHTYLKNCDDAKAAVNRTISLQKKDIENLHSQNEFLKKNNTKALKQLENLSVNSGAQAESIKKSRGNIGVKDYIYAGIHGQKRFAKYGIGNEFKGCNRKPR